MKVFWNHVGISPIIVLSLEVLQKAYPSLGILDVLWVTVIIVEEWKEGP